MTEFFWPLFFYVKQSIITYHQIPLWNNLFFAGTPLAPDSQNPIWYLPNGLLLVLDINIGIIVLLVLHCLLGFVGMYFSAKKVFTFKTNVSLIVATVYFISPIFFSFLEAGHWGLIICWAWLPVLLLATHKLANKPNLKWVILFAAAASSIYFGHVLTAFIAFVIIGIYFLYKKSFVWTTAAAVVTSVVIGPVFIMQYVWQKETTRSLLLNYPEIYPIWRGKLEFIKSLLFFTPETEKSVTFGVIPLFIAVVGFFTLKRKVQVLIGVALVGLLLIILNNVSPIARLLPKIDLLVMTRVTIRFWFLIYFVLLYLFGRALNSASSSKLTTIVGICSIVELTAIGASYLAKPVVPSTPVPQKIYSFLASDKQVFKVYCTTRCLSQKSAVIYGLHLADGYGTLQQLNYLEAAEQMGQYFWNRYSLSLPPASIYLYNKLEPHAPTLSEYGIKYVISPYSLNSKALKPLINEDGFILYHNTFFKEIDYRQYTPNHIEIAVDKLAESNAIAVPEIYNSGWTAYDQDGKKLVVNENHAHTLEVQISQSTKSIDLYFTPKPF